MKITIISDTHNKHNELDQLLTEESDVIIHCGDFTSMGYIEEVKKFLNWFSNLNQFTHKIFIAGNHDFSFEENFDEVKDLIPSNVIYLENSEVVIDGVKFYGTPIQKVFYNWAFNKEYGDLQKYYKMIPDDVDVLITHTPPLGILDDVFNNPIPQGSPILDEEIFERIKPKINCFGHIHESYGVKDIYNIKFVNASVLNMKYQITNKPIIVEI